MEYGVEKRVATSHISPRFTVLASGAGTTVFLVATQEIEARRMQPYNLAYYVSR